MSVSVLVKSGANFRLKDNAGHTPLDLAKLLSHQECYNIAIRSKPPLELPHTPHSARGTCTCKTSYNTTRDFLSPPPYTPPPPKINPGSQFCNSVLNNQILCNALLSISFYTCTCMYVLAHFPMSAIVCRLLWFFFSPCSASFFPSTDSLPVSIQPQRSVSNGSAISASPQVTHCYCNTCTCTLSCVAQGCYRLCLPCVPLSTMFCKDHTTLLWCV